MKIRVLEIFWCLIPCQYQYKNRIFSRHSFLCGCAVKRKHRTRRIVRDTSNRQVLVTVNGWVHLSACIMTILQASIYWSQMEYYANIILFLMLAAFSHLNQYNDNGNIGIKSQFRTKLLRVVMFYHCEDATKEQT